MRCNEGGSSIELMICISIFLLMVSDEIISLTPKKVKHFTSFKKDRKKQLLEEISANTTELDRFALWGTVNFDDLKYLKEKNIDLKLH